MLRRFALILLPIALLAAACGGSGGAGDSATEDTLALTDAASPADAGTPAAPNGAIPTATPLPTASEPPAGRNGDTPIEPGSATDIEPPAGRNGDTDLDTTPLDELFAGFDPFTMLGGLGGGRTSLGSLKTSTRR